MIQSTPRSQDLSPELPGPTPKQSCQGSKTTSGAGVTYPAGEEGLEMGTGSAWLWTFQKGLPRTWIWYFSSPIAWAEVNTKGHWEELLPPPVTAPAWPSSCLHNPCTVNITKLNRLLATWMRGQIQINITMTPRALKYKHFIGRLLKSLLKPSPFPPKHYT